MRFSEKEIAVLARGLNALPNKVTLTISRSKKIMNKQLAAFGLAVFMLSPAHAESNPVWESLQQQRLQDLDKAMGAIGAAEATLNRATGADDEMMQDSSAIIAESLRQLDAGQQGTGYQFKPGNEGNKQEYQKRLLENQEAASRSASFQQLVEQLGESHKNRTMGSLPVANEVEQGAVLIFVSFSMPERVLENLSRQAYQYGATLVLRGFVDDSLDKTKDLARKVNPYGAPWQIHPELFDTFNVVNVPTYVMTSDLESIENGCSLRNECATNLGYTSISGDISLMAALDYFRRDSASPYIRDMAEQMLNAE